MTEGLLKPPVGGGYQGVGGGAKGAVQHVAVKEAVLPFSRFPPEVDPALGPEMRSTGEVMGHPTRHSGRAFYKAELAAGTVLPTAKSHGMVFLSLADPDKPAGLVVAQRLKALGLGIAATSGYCRVPWQSSISQSTKLLLRSIPTGSVATRIPICRLHPVLLPTARSGLL